MICKKCGSMITENQKLCKCGCLTPPFVEVNEIWDANLIERIKEMH